MRGRSWGWVGLLVVLAFDVWWRCHTIGPTIRDRFEVTLYPVTGSQAEPLDCDEAIYAYIGKRLDGGAVMYRDLTENKPPLGYWLFALAIKIGGANELTVRLMPIPFVCATIALLWWLGLRLRGPATAFVAALQYALLSTDPFLYGNGDQMEHFINLFATASLVSMVAAQERSRRIWLIAAGVSLGAAALVKQVAAANGLLFALILLRRHAVPTSERIKDVVALSLGFASVCGLAAMILIVQGAAWDAFEDIFRYGPALATDVPPAPHSPPILIRWITGNADPSGKLPWPFGRTDYLVWWGTGSWPVWLLSLPALVWLLFGPGANASRRLLALWTLSAWVQVALPRLFWAHYYLLPLPGIALVIAVCLGDLITLARQRRALPALGAAAIVLALLWTGRIQLAEYLQVSPEDLTIRDKGGQQWVTLRALGRELSRRSARWPGSTIHVWGWQSPLYIYSGLDGVTRQVFADDLIKTFAAGNHPLVRPRIEQTLSDLRATPPTFIFCGYPPFPTLHAFLRERYLPSSLTMQSPDGRGLWVERGKYGEFEVFRPPTGTRTRPPRSAESHR